MKRVIFLFLMIMTSTNNCANFDLLESPDQKPTLQQLASLMGVSLEEKQDTPAVIKDSAPLTLVTAATAAPSSKPTSVLELRYKCHETTTCPYNGCSFNGLKSHLSLKHNTTKFKKFKKCTRCGRRYSYHSLHPAGICLIVDAASADSTEASNVKRKKTAQYLAQYPGTKHAGKSTQRKKSTKR